MDKFSGLNYLLESNFWRNESFKKSPESAALLNHLIPVINNIEVGAAKYGKKKLDYIALQKAPELIQNMLSEEINWQGIDLQSQWNLFLQLIYVIKQQQAQLFEAAELTNHFSSILLDKPQLELAFRLRVLQLCMIWVSAIVDTPHIKIIVQQNYSNKLQPYFDSFTRLNTQSNTDSLEQVLNQIWQYYCSYYFMGKLFFDAAELESLNKPTDLGEVPGVLLPDRYFQPKGSLPTLQDILQQGQES